MLDTTLPSSSRALMSSKLESEYRDLTTLPAALAAQQGGPRPAAGPSAPPGPQGTKRKLIEGALLLRAGAIELEKAAG